MKTNLSISTKKVFFIFSVLCMSINTIRAQSHQWSTKVGSTTIDASLDVTTDGSGNVLTAGYFSGTTDFDSGAGTSTLTCGSTTNNGYVLKQTSAGVYVWAKGFLGTGQCNVKSITTDAVGNIYITGNFKGTIDFDPGIATYTLSSVNATYFTVFNCKLTSAGAFVWANKIGGAYANNGNSIAIDGSGNVYVVGECGSSFSGNSTVDLDPGVAVSTHTVYNTDPFILKLDNNGNFLLGDTYAGGTQDYMYKIKTDASNNLYIIGYFDYGGYSQLGLPVSANTGAYVAKLNSSFTKIWALGFAPTNGTVIMQDLAVDGSGNVYCAGKFGETMDVLGSTTSYSLTSSGAGDYDVFALKINSTGSLSWTEKLATGLGLSVVTGVSLDPLNNIFIAGYFASTVDFNPTAAVYNKTSVGLNDIFVCRLDANGVFANDAQTYGSPGDDVAFGVQTAGIGNYYLTGYFSNTVDFNAATATNTLSSSGNFDAFTAKYIQCTVPSLSSASSPTLITACSGTQTVLTMNSVSGVTFNWFNTPGGVTTLGSGNSYTTPVVTSTVTYWAEGTNTCAATARNQFSINVAPSPTVNISASSASICAGKSTTLTASGATSYLWSSGLPANATVMASPTITTTYSVLGNSGGSCNDTQTITITVAATPTVSANNATVCSGTSVNLTATGAISYSWNTGATTNTISVSPTSLTNYTVIGTNTLGCSNTKTLSVTVNALPTVSLATIVSPLCVNNSSVSLSGSPSGGIYSGPGVSGASFNPSVSGAGTFTVTYNYTAVNTCSASATRTVSVSLCTSLTEAIEANAGINVYPNPNNGEFTILIPTKGTYTIINAIGQTVEMIDLTEDAQSINVSGLSQGIYYLVGKTAKAKIVVTK